MIQNKKSLQKSIQVNNEMCMSQDAVENNEVAYGAC
jgi:hypothetical protein